jgi:hypothetical protein
MKPRPAGWAVQIWLRTTGFTRLNLPSARPDRKFHVSSYRVSPGVTSALVPLRAVDAGVGIDPSSMAARGGLGLASMRERLRLLGGTMTLYSSPMAGTEIVAQVPLAHTTPPEHFARTVGNPMNRGRHE